ncbi:MAG: hypothetical protein C0475_07430 [Planctomyces sp.]|nr:hypothetical protein [Planctomyces sp.]MBA4038984.1 hypothetical protein [Planctomyces sp.]MBA4120249.1 hypothetical protein [Isosphaera sp.]
MSGRRGALLRRGASDRAGAHAGPNMAPMVDVVMVILVFFMASAAFVGPEWLIRALLPSRAGPEATAPRGGGAQPEPGPARIDLVVRAGAGAAGGWSLGIDGADALSPADAEAALLARVRDAESSGRQVEAVLRSEDGVPWEAVIAARDIAARAGIARVGVDHAAPPVSGAPAGR